MNKKFTGLARQLWRRPATSIRLVVCLNRVDELVVGGWDERLNLPIEAAAAEIDRKCADAVRLLSKVTDLDRSHIEYYSATKRYRLHELLNKVIANCYAGFKFYDVQPLHPEDVDGVDPEARAFTKQERAARLARRGPNASARDALFAELSRVLEADELRLLEDKFTAELRRAPKVAVLGQAGVGKTTTVNALFAAEWRTSAIEVGTHEAQQKRVRLPSGGMIDVLDLPGYGRSITEDARYEQIYRELVPSCDLVMLVLQADRGDFADDQEMILKLKEWAKGAPEGGATVAS